MIKNFFKKSVAISLLCAGLGARSSYTSAAPIDEVSVALNNLSFQIQKIRESIRDEETFNNRLRREYAGFLQSESKKMLPSLAAGQKKLFNQSIEKSDSNLKDLKEREKNLKSEISRIKLFIEIRNEFYIFSSQLEVTMGILYQNPEASAACNENSIALVSSTFFKNLDTLYEKMQNWISSCEKYNNDERLNIAKQQMMQLVGDISVLTEIAAQCYNYHLYEFVCLPKPDLLNWVIYLYNFSKSIEATFQ